MFQFNAEIDKEAKSYETWHWGAWLAWLGDLDLRVVRHLRASSTSAVMVYSVFHVSYWGHSVVYVTIRLLFDNIGGIRTFVGFRLCVYHMQISSAAI